MGKSTRYIKIVYDNEYEHCLYMDKVVARGVTTLNKIEGDIYKLIFDLGLEAFVEQLNNPSDLISLHDQAMLKIEEKTRFCRGRMTTIKSGISVLGVDTVKEIAKEYGISLDEEITRLEYSPTEIKRQWIFDYLADGKPHKIEDAVADAINAGVLPEKEDDNFSKEYGIFRSEASKIRVSSGQYGYWQLAYRQ